MSRALTSAAKVLRVAGYLWAAVLVCFHLLGLYIRFVEAESTWQGVVAVALAISPLNVVGYLLLAIAALPAGFAIAAAEALERRAMRADYLARLDAEQQRG